MFGRSGNSTLSRLALLAAVGLTPVACDAQQRPGQGRQPTIPPPTILEYQPQSTLVVPEHEVPRAKFPVVDLHGHPPTLDNPEAIERVIEAMDRLNIQVMVQARPSSRAQVFQVPSAVQEEAQQEAAEELELDGSDEADVSEAERAFFEN